MEHWLTLLIAALAGAVIQFIISRFRRIPYNVIMETLKEEYPMTAQEMWKFVEAQHAKGKAAVTEAVALPLKVSHGDGADCWKMYYGGINGWTRMNPGREHREYSEFRFRVI